jgi:peptidoglycan-associated lipoprotein
MASAVAALLVFSGCSSKDSSIDPYESNTGVTVAPEKVATETISGDTVVVDASDSNEMTMSTLESKMNSIKFAFDKFDIQPEMMGKVDENSNLANGDASNFSIKLEGNCDEWGSDEYNFALGLKRANAVKAMMVRNGVDESRISMVSYGESNPLCTDKTQACWAENSRVDSKLLP